MQDHVPRKLAVILHADIVSSTTLVLKNESLAHERIRDAFRRLSNTTNAYGGTAHEVRGDALVAEFARASDAVCAALAFQAENANHNANLDSDVRPQVRIGISLGEVVVADGTVTGAGVVLAQRLEQLAEPGRVVVQGTVSETVPTRLPFEFESLGEQSLKGFDRLVRAYVVSLKAGNVIPGPEAAPTESGPSVLPSDNATEQPTMNSPGRPSIAVLPFSNMSADSEQDFFADGMTEDIITGLSRFRSLLVSARNTSFAFKGMSPDVRAVARDLGVRYVLEGSVRRGGDRIRITGQLIDATTGNYLWAERYERELKDFFQIQDEVTEAIVAAIAPEISDVERERAERSPPESLDAWAHYQRGLTAYYSSTEEGLKSAISQLDRVSEIDPTFAPAYSMAANARWRYVMHFDPDDRSEYLSQALEKAYTAIRLDPRDPTGLWAAGKVHSMLGEHDVAVLKIEEAIRLNPNDAIVHYMFGSVLRLAGRHEEAIPHIDHALRLSPRDIWITGMLTDRAFVLFALERYEEALEWARRARSSPNPRTMTFAILGAVLSKLGRQEEARSAVADFMTHAPGMTCKKYRQNLFGTPEVMGRLVEALGKVGLPV